MQKTIRESGYVYTRGCRLCNQLKFKKDIKDNANKYYGNRKLFKIDIDECKRRFEEKGATFLDGQVYKGDKHYYYFTCKFHIKEGVQKKKLNGLKSDRVKFACGFCGIESRSKENSYLWKGGKTSENEKIRQSKPYKTWQQKVFKRDGYMCMACGDYEGKNLQAHHILNFAENRDKRFDLDNGITLCDLCHNPNNIGSFHYIYGVHNNTQEQLDEFILLKHQQNNISVEKINEIREKLKEKRALSPYKRPSSTKLTDSMIYEIIGRLKGKDSYSVIAKDYNITPSRIWEIAKGKSFKDITKGEILR